MKSRCTKFACQDEGTGVKSIKDGDVVALPLEESYYFFVPQQLVTLIGQMPHEV